MAFRFCRTQRLLKTDDFSSVFRLRQSRTQRWFQVYVRPNGGQPARLGLVVGKRTAKRAVARNYIKRTVREVFRLQQPALDGVDFVVRARECFGRKEGHEARKALAGLFAKLARCRASSSPSSASTS